MAQEVKRKRGESFESLIRRFRRRIVESGRLLQAKKVRFYRRPASKGSRRRSALYREEMKRYYDYLKKIGKMPETPEELKKAKSKIHRR